jgi:hypothetical protein
MGKSKNFGSRASSVRVAVWQSRALVLALVLAAPATAAPGGDIDTMPIGSYVCELPGDATGPAGRRVAEEDFTIVTASSYRAGGSMGSYLLTGNRLAMTSGSHQGKQYQRQSDGFVRMIGADGQPGELRCVRQTRNNS